MQSTPMSFSSESAYLAETGRHTPATTFHPQQDLMQYVREYARERPEVVALWCFGVGFVLGWKLKPW